MINRLVEGQIYLEIRAIRFSKSISCEIKKDCAMSRKEIKLSIHFSPPLPSQPMEINKERSDKETLGRNGKNSFRAGPTVIINRFNANHGRDGKFASGYLAVLSIQQV